MPIFHYLSGVKCYLYFCEAHVNLIWYLYLFLLIKLCLSLSLNISETLFWMWRHHDMTLQRHSGGAWHNGLILMTASNVNSWGDVLNHVTRLWQAGDKKISNAASRASYGPYHGLELPNHGIKYIKLVELLNPKVVMLLLSWWQRMHDDNYQMAEIWKSTVTGKWIGFHPLDMIYQSMLLKHNVAIRMYYWQ